LLPEPVALQKKASNLIPPKLPSLLRKPPGRAEKPLVVFPGLGGVATAHRVEFDFIKVPAVGL
jgi:hypothetical protein